MTPLRVPACVTNVSVKMPADDPACLELSEAMMREMAAAVVDRTVSHIASLSKQPVSGELEGVEQMCREMRETAPEQGDDLEALLEPLFERWLPATYNSASPGYLAYVPGGGLFPSALADLIADGVNRYTGVWNASPPLVQLEANVLDWFRDWMGFPASTRGLLTTGGSMATFTAVVTAREKLLGPRLREGVLYASNQAHHSVSKAAKLAGILPDRCRAITVDGSMRMDLSALEDAIAADRQHGLEPFLVVSSAGTTNTGAVDPLDAIATLCEREGIWHHCDGAYGAFFHLCPELRPCLTGMSRADSLTLDPHKGLFLPYGTGALLVRDGVALGAAHAAHAGYMPPPPDADFYNPVQYGPELSRDFRGLRAWLPIKLFGVARFRAALLEKRELALECAHAIEAFDGIEIRHEPTLSLFAFTLNRGRGLEQQNVDTKAVLDRVNARGRVMLTGTLVGDTFYGRICVLCFRTRREHIEHCIEDVRDAVSAIHAAG